MKPRLSSEQLAGQIAKAFGQANGTWDHPKLVIAFFASAATVALLIGALALYLMS